MKPWAAGAITMAAYTPTLGGGGGSRFKNHHYSQKTQMAEYLNPVQGHRWVVSAEKQQEADAFSDT